jgi:uncharacterized protein (UPF0332 family)
MSGELTPAVLMAKAVRAGASARVLLDLDDVDGACNRAYYAMFDAARAALLTSGARVPPHGIKTHGGLIAAFGLQGRLLKRAEEVRLVADYTGDSVELDDAREMVGQAERFVEAMRAEFMPVEPKYGDEGMAP